MQDSGINVFHAFTYRTDGSGNHQSGKNDTDESQQNSGQPSEWRLYDNIAVADGQTGDKGEVESFPKGHLLKVSDNSRNANYQGKQGQKEGIEAPDNYKEMVAETDKYAHFQGP
jgi:hypothetical protein